MRKHVIVFAMSIVSCLLMGQEKSEPTQTNPNAIKDSVSKKSENNQLNEILTESIDLCLKHYSDIQGGPIKNNEKGRTYICKDGFTADFPFSSMKNVVFFTLWNLDGLSKPFQKELGKGIGAYFVRIKLIGNQIIITVDSKSVRLIKKNHIELGISDWGIFAYEYSSEKQKWLLVKAEFGGI